MTSSRLAILLIGAFLVLLLQNQAASTAVTTTTVLYDAALGTTPDEQSFLFLTDPFSDALATQTFSDGATTLDTTAVIGDAAGYFAQAAPVLDRNAGFSVAFTLQVVDEFHTNSNRAGLSVIVLSNELLGIELGFWEDAIWAQEGGTENVFTRAESVAFATGADLLPFTLRIMGDEYVLLAQESPILSGPLRDYTAFEGPVDPYETPNLIFLGDNTSRGATTTRLAYAAVTTHTAVAPPPQYRSYIPRVETESAEPDRFGAQRCAK